MAKTFKILSASGFLLIQGLFGEPAQAGPRYYTCGYNGPVTTEDRCPDGTTPFLHLGIPPSQTQTQTQTQSPRPVADQYDSTADPLTCKWKRYKVMKCNENRNYYYCDSLSLTNEQAKALGRIWDAVKSQYYYNKGGYWIIR